jgi:hypothetical protein
MLANRTRTGCAHDQRGRVMSIDVSDRLTDSSGTDPKENGMMKERKGRR